MYKVYLNKKNAYIVKGNIENILHKRRYYSTNVNRVYNTCHNTMKIIFQKKSNCQININNSQYNIHVHGVRTWTIVLCSDQVHFLQWPRLFNKWDNDLHTSFGWQHYCYFIKLMIVCKTLIRLVLINIFDLLDCFDK